MPPNEITRRLFSRWMPYIVALACGVAADLVLSKYDAFEHVYAYTRAHEDWELDELFIAVFIAIVVLLAMVAIRARREISRRRYQEARIRSLARHDLLTGLPNRLFLEEELGRRISDAGRRGTELAIAVLRVHGLKAINDLNGYGSGDYILQEVALRLRRSIRPHDTVVRLDGNEFALVLVIDRDAKRTSRAAERILASVAEPIYINGQSTDVEASIGIAIFPTDTSDHEKLLQYAGVAANQSKQRGPNTTTFFDASLNDAQRQYAALRTDIRRALAEHEFVPYFQPLVRLADDELAGFEVLARWQHPTEGVLSPVSFVEAAENMGLIGDIFWQLLAHACDTVRAWPVPLPIAVNVSPTQLRDAEFGARVLDLLQQRELPADRIILEVTESALIDDIDDARRVVEFLKGHGIRFSLDDFGTGYSSLHHLKQLPFDTIKIDRSFVTDFAQDPEKLQIVSSIIGLCRGLGLKTTGEGVETIQDADGLRSLGCTYGQGYLFARPMCASAAADYVASYRTSRDGPAASPAADLSAVDVAAAGS